MSGQYSVFISAVSREFEQARDAVANMLQARGIDVKVQRSFALGGDSTLRKLHDYIRGCDRVLAVIGTYSGMYPPEGAVTDELRAMLPEGMARASMTQWEVIFARHYKRETRFFEAAGYKPEREPGEDNDSDAQATWRRWLFDGGIGQDRKTFETMGDLRADVMSLDWPNFARPKPSNLPGSIGHLFKGREEFLEQLRASFAHKSATAITGKAMHGLGGVGKTRAAIEYGHAYADKYEATFFIVGKSESDLNDSLAALTGATALNLPEKDIPDLDARVAAVLHWLLLHPGWFLIIDNVDDPEAANAVRKFLDQVGHGDGHVLITSRVSAWGHMVEPLELDLLSVDAAEDLLRESTPRRTKRDDEDAALTRLAEEQLGCLSLALVQAGAYIDEKHIGFAEYAKLFKAEAAKLLARLGKTASDNLGYPLPVALTWQASFAQLSDDGRFLLDMLAWLSIEPIPRYLFEVWPDAATVDLEEALDELTRYSFVHWEDDNSAITLHRLVAQVTRDNLDDARRDRTLEALFPWLYAVNPKINASNVDCWPRLLPLLPHALLLLMRTENYGPYPRQTSIYDEYATLFFSLARYSEAEPLYRQALAIDEANSSPDDPKIATRLNNLARMVQTIGRTTEAEPLYLRAIAIDEASLGPDHPTTAIHINNLAGLLRQTGRLVEAEPLYLRAIAIDEASLDPAHPSTAIHINNLAGLLRQTGRVVEAEPLYRRALAIVEENFGLDHPEVATSLGNLAGVLQATNRPTEAEPLFRRALAIDEASYGLEHPHVATSLANLAGVLQATNRPTEAEPLFRRALAIDEASYGLDHPDVATDLNNLAGLFADTGRWTEAAPLSRRGALILLSASKRSGHWLTDTTPIISMYFFCLTKAGFEPDEAFANASELITEAGFDPAEIWPRILGGGDANAD